MEYVHALKVETLGNLFGQYRFCTGMPQGEVGTSRQNLWVRSLLRIPEEIKTQVDVRSGTSSVGGMNFELALKDTSYLKAFATKEAPVLCYNTTALTSTSTSISLVNRDGTPATGLASILGREIIISRECMRIHTEGVPGTYQLTRGLYGTIAQPHGNTMTDDREAFDALHPSFIKTRVVEYCRYDAGGDVSSELVLWRGVIANVTAPNETVFLSCDTSQALIKRKRLLNRLWQAAADDGSTAQKGSCTIEGLDRLPVQGDATNNRRILVNIGGQTAAFVTLQIRNGGAYFEWGADTDAVEYPGSPRFVNLSPGGNGELLISECFSTRTGMPEILGNRLSANPFELALQLLTTTKGGGNGAYDIGDASRPLIGENLGCGLPASLIDVAGIEAVRDRVGTMAELDSVLIGDDPSPFDAEDFIQAILRPFGCVLTQSRNLFTVIQLQDALPVDAPKVSNDDFFIGQGPVPSGSPPRWSFDQLVVTYRHIFGRSPISQPADDVFRRSRLSFGTADSEELGIPTSSFTLVSSLGSYMISRFHFDVSEVYTEFPMLPEYDFDIGDVIGFSEDYTPNPQGELGTVDAAMFILSKRISLGRPLTYAYDGIIFSGKYGLIGPSAAVEDDGYGPDEVLIFDNYFTLVSGPYGNDLGGWVVGDKVDFLDGADLSLKGTATIIAINDGGTFNRRLVFDNQGPLVDDDIIVPTEYGLATEDQKERLAYIALSDGTLPGAEPDEWTT